MLISTFKKKKYFTNKRSLCDACQKMKIMTDFIAYSDNLELQKVKRRCLINQETNLAEIENIKSEQNVLNLLIEIDKM